MFVSKRLSGPRICFSMDLLLKTPARRKAMVVACLLIGGVLPVFCQLGGRGLNEPDEGRYAEIAREMLVTGDWLVPRLSGVPHYAKPPWIYWCVAASLKIFGMNEWAVRLPAALAGLATALTVFAFARRIGGALAGVFSALILASSLLFMVAARLITPDMMLTALITGALYCFWRWWESDWRERRWILAFYGLLGIAFLDKGPVALAVVFLSILGFLWFTGRIRDFPKLYPGRGLLLVAVIALPWFFWLCQRNTDLYDFYLRGEIVDRVVTGRGRTKSWSYFYFFMVLPIACWPWTALAVSAARRHIQWCRRDDRWKPVASLLLSWTLFPFILFTVSGSKLPTYILPLLVPISLMLGLWLARSVREGEELLPAWSESLTWALLPCLGIGVKFATYRTLGENHAFWIELVGLGIALSLLGWAIGRCCAKNTRIVARIFLWCGTAVFLVQAVLWRMPALETELRHNSSWRTLTDALKGLDVVGMSIHLDLHPGETPPRFARSGPRVVMYEFYFRGSSFYLLGQKNEIVPQYGGASLWEIAGDRDRERKLNRADLLELLRGAETVFVFTRPQYRVELQELTGMELPLIKSAGSGKYEIVLFANRPTGK